MGRPLWEGRRACALPACLGARRRACIGSACRALWWVARRRGPDRSWQPRHLLLALRRRRRRCLGFPPLRQSACGIYSPCEGFAFDRGINPTGPLDQSRGLCTSWSRGLCVGFTPLPLAGFPGRVSRAPRRAQAAAVVVAAHVPRWWFSFSVFSLGGPGAAVVMSFTYYAAGASTRPHSVRRAWSCAYTLGPARRSRPCRTCRPCPRRGIKYRRSVARLPVQARPRSTCISGRRRGCLCRRGRARPLLTRPRQCGQAPVVAGQVCGRRRGCLCRRGRARPASTVGGAAACAGEAALDPFSRGHDSAGRRPLSQGRCAMSGPGPAALPGCMQNVTRR